MPPVQLIDLEQRIRDAIPISRHLAFTLSAEGDDIVASAPLTPNINHNDTAFGGSLVMLATIAGYACLFRHLLRRGDEHHAVVQESRIRYHHPVRGALRFVCEEPDSATWQRFDVVLARWGRARIDLGCLAGSSTDPDVEFNARYVAL